MYNEEAYDKFLKLKEKEDFYILALESSCDETSASVTLGRKILSCSIASQIDIHKRFGGVVPEIASRNHTLAVGTVVKEALDKANVTLKDISAVAVTEGAGLLGALLVTVSYAKALAFALDIPIIGVNHIAGHIAANYIDSDIKPPFVCLIASGGHSAVAIAKGYNELEILGESVDDAAGEAFDKVARVLGLGYPGGPLIEKLAEQGSPVIDFPKAFKNKPQLNFSYSGLKTAVINYIRNRESKGETVNKADVAASFQKTALEMLIDNCIKAAAEKGFKQICIAGGVGANSVLRKGVEKKASELDINVHYPKNLYCTDNAAMIGVQAYYMIKEGLGYRKTDFDCRPFLKINEK